MSFRDDGEGPCVIAVHCSSSHSGQWKPLMAALEGRARVIAPDMHGYGRSEPFRVDGRPWFHHDGAMLRALIDRVDGPVHLVGHSLGAALCVMVARDTPSVQSLCLYEPVLFALLEEAGAEEVSEGWQIAAEIHGLLRLGRPRDAAKRFVDFWSGPGAWNATAPDVQGYVEATIGRVADDWSGMLGDLDGQIRLADLGALDVPCLLMSGSSSRPSARKIVTILHGAIAHSELATFEDLSHMAPVTDANEVIPVMATWVIRQLNETRRG